MITIGSEVRRMSAVWGDKVKITVFGESHGNGIGVVIDGLEPGFEIDFDKVLKQMARRAPGNDKTATPRKEPDLPKILSGTLGNVTTGAPLCAIIENTNVKSGDYGNIMSVPRPGHSDYTAWVKFSGFNDVRGGGNFSARLTAPIVFAGAVIRQILEKRGINIAAHIASIYDVEDKRFDPVAPCEELMNRLNTSAFPLIDTEKEQLMREAVENARLNCDSVGGTVECCITGLPCGAGSPMFAGVEGVISSLVFSIPAVKGIEFGAGFDISRMRGSQSNDPFAIKDGKVVTETNNCGGILGGITNGMPLIFRTAMKPTPSISIEQKSVDLSAMTPAPLVVKGRHDPCIVPRAVPVIEAAAAIAVINLI